MKPQTDISRLFRTGILILLVFSCVQGVSASSRIVPWSGVITIGETDLDVTNCVYGEKIGWWASPFDIQSTHPEIEIPVADPLSFDADPAVFTGFTGAWYSVNATDGHGGGIAFYVAAEGQPVAVEDYYQGNMNTVLKVPSPGLLANDVNPQGGRLVARVVTPPSHGTLALKADGSFTYKPARRFTGTDYFSYRVNNGINSGVAPVMIWVR